MPRFHFHIRGRYGLARDPEGAELPDVESARREAKETVQDACNRPEMYGHDFLKMEAFEITDEAGELVAVVPIAQGLAGLAKRQRST